MGLLREWRRRRYLERTRDPRPWGETLERLPLLAGLAPHERQRLIALARLFLHEKSLEPVQGAVVDEETLCALALQAALPILHLGLDAYRGWVSLILYPAEFMAEFDEVDEDGIAHRVRRPLSGESWDSGPLILAADEIEAGGERDGYNVVIHELTHKLDALDGGVANGRPPLPRGIDPGRWSGGFGTAYARLEAQLEAGEEPLIDPYAAESPAEFLAVSVELFFELPHHLLRWEPELYPLLRDLFRQDPAARLDDIR